MTASRPLQIVYLSAFYAPVEKEGDMYVFFALDEYSQFFFQLGIVPEINEQNIVNNIIQFTQNEDFVRVFKKEPFTLIVPFELDTPAQMLLKEVLQHFNAKVEYNQELVFEKTKPVLNSIFNI